MPGKDRRRYRKRGISGLETSRGTWQILDGNDLTGKEGRTLACCDQHLQTSRRAFELRFFKIRKAQGSGTEKVRTL
jgi:hypothetical protein